MYNFFKYWYLFIVPFSDCFGELKEVQTFSISIYGEVQKSKGLSKINGIIVDANSLKKGDLATAHGLLQEFRIVHDVFSSKVKLATSEGKCWELIDPKTSRLSRAEKIRTISSKDDLNENLGKYVRLEGYLFRSKPPVLCGARVEVNSLNIEDGSKYEAVGVLVRFYIKKRSKKEFRSALPKEGVYYKLVNPKNMDLAEAAKIAPKK